MHAVMHNDGSIIAPEFREDVLRRASNYVEVTLMDGAINIENSCVGVARTNHMPWVLGSSIGWARPSCPCQAPTPFSPGPNPTSHSLGFPSGKPFTYCVSIFPAPNHSHTT